jgi:hypothetical protein
MILAGSGIFFAIIKHLINLFYITGDNSLRTEIIKACETIGSETVKDFIVEQPSPQNIAIQSSAIEKIRSGPVDIEKEWLLLLKAYLQEGALTVIRETDESKRYLIEEEGK